MRLVKTLSTLLIATSLTGVVTTSGVEASSNKVMWGKTELKLGQIGKIIVLEDTPLFSMIDNRTLVSSRTLKKGEEFRVYNYSNLFDGLYGVGGKSFIVKDNKIRYETPSKNKLTSLTDKPFVVTLPNK